MWEEDAEATNMQIEKSQSPITQNLEVSQILYLVVKYRVHMHPLIPTK